MCLIWFHCHLCLRRCISNKLFLKLLKVIDPVFKLLEGWGGDKLGELDKLNQLLDGPTQVLCTLRAESPSIFLDKSRTGRRLCDSALPDLSRKIEGDSARRVITV